MTTLATDKVRDILPGDLNEKVDPYLRPVFDALHDFMDPRLVERGLQFQREMEVVQDPERLIYVAGYDQDTPYRIKVKRPGVFEYQITRDGDGRVPHDLGLLDDVRTYYVRAEHGDPFAVLGPHPAGAHTVLRALLPGLRTVLMSGGPVDAVDLQAG